MVYIVPTEASNGPKYMYIAYLMLTITDITYIRDNFGLTTDDSNKMSCSAELNQSQNQGIGIVFKLHKNDY